MHWWICTGTLTYFNTLQKPVNIQASASLIGESVSEPHTSEFNGRISLIYIRITHCTSNARVCVPNAGYMLCDLTTHAYQDVFLLGLAAIFGLGSWSIAFTHWKVYRARAIKIQLCGKAQLTERYSFAIPNDAWGTEYACLAVFRLSLCIQQPE